MDDRRKTAAAGCISDTDAGAEAVRLAAIRARSPELRLRDAFELSELMQVAVMAKLRARLPTKSLVDIALMHVGDDASTSTR